VSEPLAANESVFAMAGHSLNVKPGTEADLFLLPNISTYLQ